MRIYRKETLWTHIRIYRCSKLRKRLFGARSIIANNTIHKRIINKNSRRKIRVLQEKLNQLEIEK